MNRFLFINLVFFQILSAPLPLNPFPKQGVFTSSSDPALFWACPSSVFQWQVQVFIELGFVKDLGRSTTPVTDTHVFRSFAELAFIHVKVQLPSLYGFGEAVIWSWHRSVKHMCLDEVHVFFSFLYNIALSLQTINQTTFVHDPSPPAPLNSQRFDIVKYWYDRRVPWRSFF